MTAPGSLLALVTSTDASGLLKRTTRYLTARPPSMRFSVWRLIFTPGCPGMCVGVTVGVDVGVGVAVGVGVNVEVGVADGVNVGVAVAVCVDVGVGVAVGV